MNYPSCLPRSSLQCFYTNCCAEYASEQRQDQNSNSGKDKAPPPPARAGSSAKCLCWEQLNNSIILYAETRPQKNLPVVARCFGLGGTLNFVVSFSSLTKNALLTLSCNPGLRNDSPTYWLLAIVEKNISVEVPQGWNAFHSSSYGKFTWHQHQYPSEDGPLKLHLVLGLSPF